MHKIFSTQAIRFAVFSTLLMSAVSGCYKATFIANPAVVRGEEHDEWNSFFLWGLVGEETLDVRQFCPGGTVAQVRTGANVLTGFVSFITLGIYAPRKAYVWCAVGRAGDPTPGQANQQNPTLAIYADSKGRPVRVELHRGETRQAVAVPLQEQDLEWRVAFAPEVFR